MTDVVSITVAVSGKEIAIEWIASPLARIHGSLQCILISLLKEKEVQNMLLRVDRETELPNFRWADVKNITLSTQSQFV